MGCIQTKKLGDNEIIKVNYPENQISNTTNANPINTNKKEEKTNRNLTPTTKEKTKNEIKEIKNSNIRSNKENQIDKSEYNNKITKAEISEEDKKKIFNSLQNHFLFKNKSQNIISNIIDLLQMQKLSPNTTLFNKGDKGNYFYIIKKGKLELIAEYGKKILNQDETFGELALIENKERTATVKSKNSNSKINRLLYIIFNKWKII